MYTNGGHQDYNYTSTMKMLPFRAPPPKNPIANILYFAAVAHILRITIDTYTDYVVNTNIDNGTIIKFK